MAGIILALNDIIEVTQFGTDTLTGAEVLNRHHAIVNSVPGTPTDTIIDAADGYFLKWLVAMGPVMSVDYQADRTTCKRITTAVQLTPTAKVKHPFKLFYDIGGDHFGTWDGTNPGPSMPSFVTASIQNRTGLLGRYWRGGIHLGPICLSSVIAGNENQLTTGAITAYRSAYDLYRGNTVLPGATQLNLVVFSPTYLAWVLPPATAPRLATTTITSSFCTQWVRSQLSRKSPHIP